MKLKPYQEDVFRLVSGELPPEEEADLRARIEGNEEAMALLARFEETVGAMKAFNKCFENMPLPAIPSVRRIPGLRFFSYATAALLLLGSGLTIMLYDRDPIDTPPTRTVAQNLSEELAWTMNLDTRSTGANSAPEPASPSNSDANSGKSDTAQFNDKNNSLANSASNSRSEDPRKNRIEAYTNSFAFDFTAPREILDDYRLLVGRARAKDRARLIYLSDEGAISVYMSKSDGEDTRFHEVELGERKILAARRRGIMIGFRDLPEGADPDVLSKLFLPDNQ